MKLLIRRSLYGIALGMLALIPAAAADRSWNGLQRLSPGDPIEVVVLDHKEKGTFVASSAETLTILTNSGEKRVARQQVMRVTAKSNSHRVRNLLICLGVGVAIAAVTDATLGTRLRNESNPDNARALIWSIPIAAGAAAGAVLPSNQTIYKR